MDAILKAKIGATMKVKESHAGIRVQIVRWDCQDTALRRHQAPIGRDNKHGWYEEHEKFVAIAAGSLSSVLLVGYSLVNGLARYHRVWSKYFKPLHALNFGVGGDRTQHVL